MGVSIRTYQRRIAALHNIICNIQWVQPSYNGAPSCSGCGAMKHQGCDESCPVAAVTGDYGARREAP
jgi:hypothetical protein